MRATKWSLLLLASLVAIMVYATAVMAAPTCSVSAQIANATNRYEPETTNGSPTLVTLNGTGSKQNATSMSWEQISGPTVTFSYDFDNQTGLPVKASFFAPSVGPSGAILTFKLTVAGCTPTLYSSATATVNITNVNQNQAPTASAVVLVNDLPTNIANEGDAVALNGTASSDPDGDALIFTWSQIAGAPTVTLANSNSAIATFTAPVVPFPDGASLTFRLTVSDGTLSNSTEKIVTVHWVNDPPIASLQCPASVNEGDPVTLDGGLSSDNDGDGIASYAWIQTQAAPVADLSGCLSSGATCSFTAPQLGPQYNTMSFKLTVTDNGGLSNAAECSVIVLDVTPPAITVPSDITAEATSASGAIVDFSVSATDLVDGSVLVSCSTPTSGSTFALGDTKVTCSASDKAGNTASASFTVTVQDTTPPSLTLPTPITEEATGPSGATVTYSVTANDLVDGPVTPSCSPASGSTFALGTTSVNCSATDAHSNKASGSFSVTVVDTTPPVIAAHANETAEATSAAGAIVSYASPTTSDAVDGAGTATCSPASGSTFALGETTVTCNATDAAGNKATATTFIVKVQDTTPPVIAAHANETAEATSAAGAVVTYVSPATSDAVDGAKTATCLPASGSTFALGETTVTCNATDAAGNKAIATTFVVKVQDTTPPVLTLPANKTAEATGPAGAAVTFAASATDIVDGSVAVTCIPASGSTFALGATTVNCSATDAHSNKASGSFTVTVVDTTPPKLTLPSNITTDASSLSGANVTFTASADDLVDGSVTPVCTPASGSTFAPGSTTVNCSATDSHGNRASGSFIVTVTFRLSGFYSPIDMNGVTNTVKGGSTVPMKFEVFAGATELTSTSAILSIKTQQISCTFVSGAEDPLPTDALATGGTSLRYDSTGGQFIYNWQTPKSAGACFVVTMTTLDGSHISANFKLK